MPCTALSDIPAGQHCLEWFGGLQIGGRIDVVNCKERQMAQSNQGNQNQSRDQQNQGSNQNQGSSQQDQQKR